MKKGAELESLPGHESRKGVSIDDLLDVAGHRCCRSRGNRIKEREKPGELDTCKRPPFLRCLSIDIFIFLCIVITGLLRVGQNLDPA